MKTYMHIYLKGGGDFSIMVTEFTVGRDAFGALREIRWTAADGGVKKAKFIDLDQVAAVVREEW